MSQKVTISLDAMGGDHGPSVVVPAAINSLKRYPNLELILVGDRDVLHEHLANAPEAIRERIVVRHATQIVRMDELPSQALRGKKDSSMRVAINLVKEGEAAGCVSAGNTGALMATARFVLKTLPGIDRPAIISPIPSRTGHTHMLDLGANADCTPEHLFQFAVMGSVLASVVYGTEKPAVGLLNIGEEEIKGNERVKQAAELLSNSALNYIGFVEGTDIFTGEVDVVVADGFVGNVALKSIEGLAKLIGENLKEGFSRNLLSKLSAVFAMPVLNRFKRRFDPRRYNGASLVGLRGNVIKSHGSADVFAYENAISMAILEAEQNVPGRIRDLLEKQFSERQAV